MSEITEHLSGYLGELNNYMNRFNHNTLSRRDRQIFFEMSNEYYEIFQKSIEEDKGNINSFPSDLLEDIETFNGNIIDPADDRKLANQYYEFITSRSNYYIQTVEHAELQMEIFRKDAEIMRLQSEKLQMMQRLTDIEIQRDGKLSQVTKEILEVQNSELVNGRVREIGAWEREASETPSAGSVPKVQPEPEVPDHVEEKTKPSMERKRVIDKDEVDRMLNEHSREVQSGNNKMLNLSNCVISNHVFKGDMSNISFDNAELRYCEFRETKADNVSLQNAALTNCTINQAEFDHSDLKNAAINQTFFRDSMFRECSFDAAALKNSSIEGTVFYKTTFDETSIRECSGGENIYHKCNSPENTVRIEKPKNISKDKFNDYRDTVKDALFGNGDYTYEWYLKDANLENYNAEFLFRISYKGEIQEEQKYSAILNPDTYEITHMDTGRHDDAIVKMFMPEINAVMKRGMELKSKYAREKEENKDTGSVILKLPYMSKETFMKVTKQIKSMGAKFNPSKKEWYVPAGAGKDTIDSIKSYLDVHDEAIYLKLPPVKKEEFKQMTDQLKKDGARYNPDKKRWYITEDTELNRNKFYRYLPLFVTLFKPEKDSVHGKLDQYRSEAEKKQPASGIQEYQKRETPERV